MNKKIKFVLVISLLFNFVFLSCGSYFVHKKGGISYFKSKMVVFQQQSNAYETALYLDRKSTFNILPIRQDSIVFLGDSITQWTEWSEMFPDQNVINRGIAGDTTLGMLNRIEDIAKTKPKKVFIMIGVNDIGKGMPNIFDNYKQILQKLKEQSPNTLIYVESVLPTNGSVDNKKIRSLNNDLKNLCQEQDYEYIDLYSKFIASNG